MSKAMLSGMQSPTPAISVGPPQHAECSTRSLSKCVRMMWQGACDVCSACNLHHVAALLTTARGGHVTAKHLIRPTADRYSCTVGISVSVKMRKPIYRIRDTAMQRVNTQRHGISA